MKEQLQEAFIQAEEYINATPKFTIKNKPEHTTYFMNLLGNPQESFSTIHVAGSNGKGSVSAMISSMFIQEGKNVGLFISPHLMELTERFQIKGQNATKEEFLLAMEEVQIAIVQLQKDGYTHPTHFEFLFAIGMVIFANRKVEIAVIETGMGGRLDATNVLISPLVTIITSISLEHTKILGDSLEKIAAEKAGIIKNGRPVIFDGKHKEVNNIILKKANQESALAYPIYPESIRIIKMENGRTSFYSDQVTVELVEIPFQAPYQVENASIALMAGKLLSEMGFLLWKNVIKGLAVVRWPGRMEVIKENVIFDGAHNEDGINAFIQAVKTMNISEPVLLFSMLKEKDSEKVVALLSTRINWKSIIITRVQGDRAMEPLELLQLFKKNILEKEQDKCLVIEGNKDAYRYADKLKGKGTLFCVGSLYLIGDMKRIVEEEND